MHDAFGIPARSAFYTPLPLESPVYETLCRTKVIVLDEVSMLGPHTWEILMNRLLDAYGLTAHLAMVCTQSQVHVNAHHLAVLLLGTLPMSGYLTAQGSSGLDGQGEPMLLQTLVSSCILFIAPYHYAMSYELHAAWSSA